jgi:MoaA/NifB/PqqE/SkfB family radical SAM enzyme
MTTASDKSMEYMLWREKVANRPKHWVRAVTACNSKCSFCLDMDTPRNVYLSEDEVKAEIRRGFEELGADKVIISGGEASLHPKFFEFIRYAKELGYDRVQTVTNGYMFGDKAFYDQAVEAGLGEITFSLHGHTAELHDRMTQTQGAFKRIMKAMIRAVRERRVIVNVDTVINKQNVGVLDKIVELAASVGVTEFDLLHVIPQAAAFENRDELFYDPRDYIDVLQKVFRLTRHPRFVIWTNRFPVPFLEDLEDLIQDPHKMLDEINGRRFHVRKYLDTGEPLNCREPERCVHCFIEPYCTTMERTMEGMNENSFEVWSIGSEPPTEKNLLKEMPYGITKLGLNVESLSDIPNIPIADGIGVYAKPTQAQSIDISQLPAAASTLVASTPEHLDAWLTPDGIPDGINIEILLTKDTGEWMLEHRDQVESAIEKLHIHQPSYEFLIDASQNDYREPATFFTTLNLPVSASGLPACLMPGVKIREATRVLTEKMFDLETGRLHIRELSRHHVSQNYRSKSLRCDTCVISDRCEGGHINMIRDQGLRQLQPILEKTPWAKNASAQLLALHPETPKRIATGCESKSAPTSLPGYAEPTEVAEDPLAVIERKRQERRERMAQRAAQSRKKKDASDGEPRVSTTH